MQGGAGEEITRGRLCVRIVSKGQSWSVCVDVLSILRLKLTRDHVPREQYIMQMKLPHMVKVNWALNTQAQKHVDEPSAFPHFHAKSANPCNRHLCSVCDRGKKKKREKTGEENRMRGEDKRWIAKRQTLNRGNKSNQPIPSPAPTD